MSNNYVALLRAARERGTHTDAEWQTMKRFFRFRCVCCRTKVGDAKLTKDHVVPISKQGSDSITNIQPMCALCNTQKGATAVDYRRHWRNVPAEFFAVREGSVAEFDVKQIAKAINIPLKMWAGNCYAIACEFVNYGIVEGRAAYGHYRGFVHAQSIFYSRWQMVGFCRHGWVIANDGSVVDPTRFVFEAAEPYVWSGEATKEYDEGGDLLRLNMEGTPPRYDDGQERIDITFTDAALLFVLDVLGNPPDFRINQIFWLANLSRRSLGEYAEPIYKAVVEAGKSAWIPFDNKRLVLK